MHHSAHYRRFHRLHTDVLAVLALAVSGWFLWPSAPPASSRTPSRESPVAYGRIEARSVGPLLYPGHFAFSSPIGFGSMAEALRAGDPRWSLAGMRPFLEPLPPPATALPPRASAPASALSTAMATLDAALPRPEWMPYRSLRGTPAPSPPMSHLKVQRSEPLEARDFNAAALEPALLAVPVSAGELRAYLHLTPQGRVANVLFAPTPLPWTFLRSVEAALLRGVASPAPEAAEGWMGMLWQHPEPLGRDPSAAP